MRYETTNFTDGLEILKDIFPKVQAESGIDGHELNLQDGFYKAVDRQGIGIGIIAYEGDKPVGFVGSFLTPYQQTGELMGFCDVIYVLPEYRHTTVAGQLIIRTEREAKRRGATMFSWSARVDSPLSQVFLKRVPSKHRYYRFIREL